MTPDQRAAAVVAVSAQLDVIEQALSAARATLAVLTMEAEDTFAEKEPVVGTEDPETCGHPDVMHLPTGGGHVEVMCTSCGKNLT
jgi:hypothetical protein